MHWSFKRCHMLPLDTVLSFKDNADKGGKKLNKPLPVSPEADSPLSSNLLTRHPYRLWGHTGSCTANLSALRPSEHLECNSQSVGHKGAHKDSDRLTNNKPSWTQTFRNSCLKHFDLWTHLKNFKQAEGAEVWLRRFTQQHGLHEAHLCGPSPLFEEQV